MYRLQAGPLLGAAFAALSAFALRAFWIDHPVLWLDELFTLLYARNDVGYLLSLTRTSDIHPPFYYLLVKAVAALFGEGDGTQLRLISAAGSALSAGLVYLFAYRRFGLTVAVLASAFFVLLPINIHYGRELRTYAVLSLALLAATICFIEMTEPQRSSRGRRLLTVGYVLSLALCFHLHYSAAVYFLLFGAAALGLRLTEPDSRRLRHAMAATAAAGILCLPQAYHFVLARNAVAGDFWIPPTDWSSFYSTTLGMYPFPAWGKAVVFAVYLAGAFVLWSRDRRFAVVSLTFIAGGPLVVALIGILSPAYLVRTIQAYATLSPFLIAVALHSLPRRALLPAVVALEAIHLQPIRASYPPQKQALAGDLIAPLLAETEPEAVFYFNRLSDHFDLRRIDRSAWTPVALEEGVARDQIDARLDGCVGHGGCGPTVIIMEKSPIFQIEDGRAWMDWMDRISERHGAAGDEIIQGLRVIIVR